MALWVFGCSFSVDEGPSADIKYPTWAQILASKLGLDEYHNYAQWGVSNEYIIDQFMQQQSQIQPGDTVIIQLTEKSRQWFFKDNPCVGNFYIVDLERHVSKAQANAIKEYITHLDSDDSQNMRYAITCMALNHVSTQLAACKILILPGFNYVPGVTGSLLEVCNNEFTSDESRLAWYAEHPVDIRINHMSEKNHHILADKIFYTFNTGTVLDLTTGFDTGFL